MTVERMIELLKIEKGCVLRNASGECNRYCAGCDLLQDDTELHEMYTEVIALLKAQEPRLLTAEDFESNTMLDDDGRLPCWCEDMVGGDGWTAVSVGGVLPDHVKANGCRYWTSRPTDEQREAEPWAVPDMRRATQSQKGLWE